MPWLSSVIVGEPVTVQLPFGVEMHSDDLSVEELGKPVVREALIGWVKRSVTVVGDWTPPGCASMKVVSTPWLVNTLVPWFGARPWCLVTWNALVCLSLRLPWLSRAWTQIARSP